MIHYCLSLSLKKTPKKQKRGRIHGIKQSKGIISERKILLAEKHRKVGQYIEKRCFKPNLYCSSFHFHSDHSERALCTLSLQKITACQRRAYNPSLGSDVVYLKRSITPKRLNEYLLTIDLINQRHNNKYRKRDEDMNILIQNHFR